ncbi:hypothetical protein Tco_0748970 [Tanacetum coccineum]|uniref:Uncharacterized protein n=1 Tax=Tanacetum coccineum TaxID=301880 RepID=A0ABQ4YX37_9ASTR
MDSMFTTWKRLTDENPSVASNEGNTAMNTINEDTLHVDVPSPKATSYSGLGANTTNHVDKTSAPSHESPIVQAMDINLKTTSYVKAACASAKDRPKVNSNFHPFVPDLVFNGVNISIPCKIVEKVSTCFQHTLHGYFIGKRMAFPVVEYYVRNNWGETWAEKDYDEYQRLLFL